MTAADGRFPFFTPAHLLGLLASVWLAAAACGSTTQPTPTPLPDVTNAAPTISSLTSGSVRVEAGNDLLVTAVVADAETPVDQLFYDWSASPVSGSFAGSGRQVKWRAPFLQAPNLYTLTLRVTETYASKGVPKENLVSSNVQVHYNDSYLDINRISSRFLTQLFPDFLVTAQQAVQDFSGSTVRQPDGSVCADEKAAELSQIANNRIHFHILSGTYTNVSIDLNGDRTFADVFGTCVFEDIPQDPSNPFFGRRERVTGICHLTAVYEQWKWFLCASHFAGVGVTPESLRYRVPGRIVATFD